MVENQGFTERFERDYKQLERMKADILSNPTPVKVNSYLETIRQLNSAARQLISEPQQQLQIRKDLCDVARELAIVLHSQKRQTAYALFMTEILQLEFSDIEEQRLKLNGDCSRFEPAIRQADKHQKNVLQMLQALSSIDSEYGGNGASFYRVYGHEGEPGPIPARGKNNKKNIALIPILLLFGIGIVFFILPKLKAKGPADQTQVIGVYTPTPTIYITEPSACEVEPTIETMSTPGFVLYSNIPQAAATQETVLQYTMSPTATVTASIKPTAALSMTPTLWVTLANTPTPTLVKVIQEKYLQIQADSRPEYSYAQYGAYRMRIEIKNISKTNVNSYNLCYTTQDPDSASDKQAFFMNECHICDTIQQVFGPGAHKYSSSFAVDVPYGKSVWVGIVGVELNDGTRIQYEPDEIQFISWTVYQR